IVDSEVDHVLSTDEQVIGLMIHVTTVASLGRVPGPDGEMWRGFVSNCLWRRTTWLQGAGVSASRARKNSRAGPKDPRERREWAQESRGRTGSGLADILNRIMDDPPSSCPVDGRHE